MSEIPDLKVRLKEFADVVNAFKSEAGQLRVVDVLLAQLSALDKENLVDYDEETEFAILSPLGVKKVEEHILKTGV